MIKRFFNKQTFSLIVSSSLLLSLLAGFSLVLTGDAFAAPAPPAPGVIVGPTNNPSNLTTPAEAITIIQTILGWAFAFAVVIGSAMIIYAGIIYLTSAGSADKVKNAVQIMIYAVVGIAVAGFAWSIINVVQNLIFTKPTNITGGG